MAIKSLSFKKSITAAFGITFNLKFLPMELIHGGKTNRSLPRKKFPDSFSLRVNEKDFSDTHKSLKLINGIITSYLEKKHEILDLWEQQQAFLIIKENDQLSY